jgi:hypothetical protein
VQKKAETPGRAVFAASHFFRRSPLLKLHFHDVRLLIYDIFPLKYRESP